MNAPGRGCLALLFAHRARPDAAAIHALAARSEGFAVTLEPEGANWLELLVHGLGFDLLGLAGGPPAATPADRHRFDFDEEPAGRLEALSLVAGPHLAGGEAMLPVVRSQLALALILAELPGLQAVGWSPAQSWMGADYFKRSVAAWLEGGPFPALGLTAVTPTFDGALQSEGLAFFTGQELRIEPELAEDRVAATKLAVRLLDELVVQGALSGPIRMEAPGEAMLALEPSPNGVFIRVRRTE